MNFAESLLNNPAPLDKKALLTQQGDATYGELKVQAHKVAHFLKSRGLKAGDRVLLMGESSLFWVQAYLGVALAGGVSVPLAVPSSPDFLASVLEATEPGVAFVQAKWLRRLDLSGSGVELVVSDARPPRLESDAELVTMDELGTATAPLVCDQGKDDLAVIMFTSGSTATPRGVMVSHGNILANTADIITSMDIGPDDRMMAVLPFYYCFGTSLLHTHLMAGGSVVVDNRFLFPEKVLNNLVETRCTSLAGVPSTYQILLRRSSLKKMDLPHLVKVQQAGGKLAQIFIDELEEALPRARVFIMYGQTEATARLSCISPEERHQHPGSIGKGLASTRLNVLDENGCPVKPGTVGEIVATGPNITLGYWNNPEATAKNFSGGLRTGDLATVDEDGYIKIVDRARDFLKCGGKRVSCRQIEETLLAFAGMTEAAVVGIPDLVLGEAVYLFAVHPEGKACEGALQKFCEKELDRTLWPKGIEFLDGLPRNSSGKPDKLALKKKVADLS
jgi:acyl-CoA synthetase (AMP-forming)/AMP-acid ligase II|nr:AMP-binding protein [Candidatus Krumholzibacteria bacterium]